MEKHLNGETPRSVYVCIIYVSICHGRIFLSVFLSLSVSLSKQFVFLVVIHICHKCGPTFADLWFENMVPPGGSTIAMLGKIQADQFIFVLPKTFICVAKHFIFVLTNISYLCCQTFHIYVATLKDLRLKIQAVSPIISYIKKLNL